MNFGIPTSDHKDHRCSKCNNVLSFFVVSGKLKKVCSCGYTILVYSEKYINSSKMEIRE